MNGSRQSLVFILESHQGQTVSATTTSNDKINNPILFVGEPLSMSEKEKSSSPPVPANWDRCHAFLESKNRFCRQRPQEPSVYCGNHQHLDVQPRSDGRKRIPCPIDPSHLIFEDMVDRHILICPRAKKRKRQEQQPYFEENINCGGHGSLGSSNHSEAVLSLQWAQKLALRVMEVNTSQFSTESSDMQKALTDITLEDLHAMLPMKDLSKPELDAGMESAFERHRIKSGGARHIPQLASLVGNLRSMGVIASRSSDAPSDAAPLILLEMGAGRGMFGLAAAGASAATGVPTRLVMIERTGSRSKADKIFRTLPTSKERIQNDKPYCFQLQGVQWTRVECDLAHVSLPKVLKSITDQTEAGTTTPRVVVIAKHLCGAGTDLALKAMEPVREQVHACLLATCCHGICDWKEYVGRDYLRKMMIKEGIAFGPEEFNLMRRWCAATVATTVATAAANSTNTVNQQPDEEDEHGEVEEPNCSSGHTESTSISNVVESLKLKCGIQGLGRACQRLIDYGRVNYLQSNVLTKHGNLATTELFHYVPSTVSPQNACMGFCCRPCKK
eukprot:Nitzschia sp. Nitz4//scaffold195_size40117//32815//34534//NITZ4_007580-RA/size40117-processed-gene-0.17-mRNA-1//1//CDS//3329540377//2940//frame0